MKKLLLLGMMTALFFNGLSMSVGAAVNACGHPSSDVKYYAEEISSKCGIHANCTYTQYYSVTETICTVCGATLSKERTDRGNSHRY